MHQCVQRNKSDTDYTVSLVMKDKALTKSFSQSSKIIAWKEKWKKKTKMAAPKLFALSANAKIKKGL